MDKLKQQSEEAFCLENRGLVQAVAARFLGRGVEREDLVQIGFVGLLRARRSFDETRGCCFSTYAVPLICGAIRDHLREHASLKVSRTLRRQAAALARAREELGEGASVSDCAAHAGLSAEEAALAAGALCAPLSLSEEEGVREIAAYETGYETVLDRVALSEGLSRLEKEERALISLRYFRSLTQEQTARVLGLTQCTVSRMEKRILQRLRELLSS